MAVPKKKPSVKYEGKMGKAAEKAADKVKKMMPKVKRGK